MAPRDPALAQLFGMGIGTASGVAVNADTALRITAVMACIRVLSETIASLPLKVYKVLPDGGKEPDRNNPLWALLHDQPNRWQTSFEFREMLVGHVALRGNGYAEVVSTGGRGSAELIPMHPDRVTPFWAPGGGRAYEYAPPSGPSRVLLQDEVLHVAGMGFDGLRGLDPIAYAREAMGLAVATEKFGAKFFANDARPGVYLQHPQMLSAEAAKRLKDAWELRHSGAENSHKAAVLEEGMTVQQIGVDPDHAQFIESRKFQVTEIARFFRIPPHLIGDLDRSTNNNIEQQSLEFVIHTIRPWLVRFEQAIRRDVMSDADKRTRVVEFDVNGLLRGDLQSRYAAFSAGRSGGWLSVNDIRRMENMNPIDQGDIYLQPLNMVKAGEAPPQPAALRAVFDAAAERIVRKEMMAAEKAQAEGMPHDQWAAGFYPGHARFVAQALGVGDSLAQEYCQQRMNHDAATMRETGIETLTTLMERGHGN